LRTTDVGLLYQIITRAERKPDVERLPFRALFAAYDEVLAEHGPEADPDQACMRFLFKMGTKGLRGQSLFERFEDLLRQMGIVLELDDTEYEGNHDLQEHSFYSAAPDGQQSQVLEHNVPPAEDTTQGIRRRRASFNSMRDVGDDATQRSAYRPSSRSSMSRLQVGKPEFLETERPFRQGSSSRERAESPNKQLLAQFLELARRLMGGRDPLKEEINGQRDPAVNGDGTRPQINGHLTSSSGRASHTPSSSVSSRDSREPHVNIGNPGPAENVDFLNEVASRPSLSDLLRDASTFNMYRRRATARQILIQWFEKAVRLQQSHRDMEALAANMDRMVLLRQALELWRAGLRQRRQLVHTERFFKHLERRAERARDLYLMTKAFTHWAQLTSDELSRTSTARQHILRIKYFNAWREITAVNELKAQRFGMKRLLGSWKRGFQKIQDDEAKAVAVYTANLKKKYYRGWLWGFYYRRVVPDSYDYRLKRRSLICWLRALRTQREREQEIDHQYGRGLLQCAFQIWVDRSRSLVSAEKEADSQHKKKILSDDLEEWRAQARLSSAAARVSEMTERRIAQTALGRWALRAKAVQQAKEVDRLRVMRNAWTAWNDRLRCQALNARIEERLKMEAIYKWVLAERYRLAQRIRDQRILREAFATFILNARATSSELMQRERQHRLHRNRELLRSKLTCWRERLALERQREYMASEFYVPRIEQEALAIWTSKYEHVKKLERWAEDARFYFLAMKTIKQWHVATVNLSKKRRQEAYAKVRRKVKTNLASSALVCCRAKARQLAKMEQQAVQISRDKSLRIASELLDQWHQKTVKIAQDCHDADVYYHRQLAYHLLTRWIDSSKKYRALEEQALGLELLHVSGVAAAQLRKLSLRIFQMNSTMETADAMYGRVLRKHFRNILRHWAEKTRLQREARGFSAPSVSDTTEPGIPEGEGPNTPRPEWTIAESESTLNSRELMSLPDRQQTTPIATPGYLSSPSRRAARARMLAQVSTTPATPLYTPFASRLRAALVTEKTTSSRHQSRRSSLGTMVRFVDEEPESPTEGRRSARRE
jgi:protein SFI1